MQGKKLCFVKLDCVVVFCKASNNFSPCPLKETLSSAFFSFWGTEGRILKDSLTMEEFFLTNIFLNPSELSNDTWPVDQVPSYKPTTSFLGLNTYVEVNMSNPNFSHIPFLEFELSFQMVYNEENVQRYQCFQTIHCKNILHIFILRYWYDTSHVLCCSVLFGLI